MKAEAKLLRDQHTSEFRFLRGQGEAPTQSISELARNMIKPSNWEIDLPADRDPHISDEDHKREHIHTVLDMWAAEEGHPIARQEEKELLVGSVTSST